MSRKQPALQRTTKKGCPGPDNRKRLSRILHEFAGRFLHRPSTRHILRALRAALPLFRASRRIAFFVRRYRLAAAVHQLFSVPENRKPRTVVSRRQAGGNPRGIERVTNCVRHPHSTDSTVALPTTGRLELGASGRIRIVDLLVMGQALCHLSYGGEIAKSSSRRLRDPRRWSRASRLHRLRLRRVPDP